MKILEPYGRRLMSYEGTISIGEDAQREGYFEALQALDGTIVVACAFNDPVPLLPGNLTLPIKAVDFSGWTLCPEGQVFCTSCNVPCVTFDLPSTQSATMCMAVIKPTYLRGLRAPGRRLGYLNTRFMVANLLLDHSADAMPNPVQMSLQGRIVKIAPLPDYQEKAKRLRAVGGIEWTVFVDIRDGGCHETCSR